MYWFKNNKFLWCAVITMMLPIAVYIFHFRNYNISDTTADWGSFGDYIGGIYSVLIAILVLYLSHLFEKNRERDASIKVHAEKLYTQINVIKNNNYNLRSCSKLITLVNNARLYLPLRICEKTESLANNYMSHKNDGEELNKRLEEETKRELKRIYEC